MNIVYVGKSEGETFDLYHLLADGERPVLEVLVDTEDTIWIAAIPTEFTPFLGTMPQVTKGKVHRHPLDELDAETALMLDLSNTVEASTGICLGSIAGYVVPRIATLMARVYCPARPITVTMPASPGQ